MKVCQIKRFLAGMCVGLATTDRHRRQAMGGKPVGVDPTVGHGVERIAIDRTYRCFGRTHAGVVCGKYKRLVVQAAVKENLAFLPQVIFDFFDGALEGTLDLTHDAFAKLRVVAAGFGSDSNLIRDDVGRLTTLNETDIASAGLFAF